MMDPQVRLSVDVAVTDRAVRPGAKRVVIDRVVRRGVRSLVTGLQSPTDAGGQPHHPLFAAADR